MNKLKYFFTLIIGLAMVACSSKDDYSQEKTEIKVNAGIQGLLTRADQSSGLQDNDFDENSSFKLYLTNASGTQNIPGTPETGYFTVTKKSTGYTFDTKAYYPEDGSLVNAFAIYPTRASKGDTKFSVINMQRDYDFYAKSDLMYAYKGNNAKSASPISLTFKHCLCKIVVIVVDPDGNACDDLDDYEVYIDELNTTIDLAYTNNSITTVASTDTDAQEIELGDYYSPEGVAAIVVPQTFKTTTKISFRNNDITYSYTPSVAFDMEGGYVYTFKLKLDKTALTGTYSITNWTNVEKTGNIIKE